MPRRFWERILMPTQDPEPRSGRAEEFQTALPGDLSEWDFVGDFTLVPAGDGSALGPYDRSQCQEWARRVAAECTHSFSPLDWVQAQAYANQALAASSDDRGLPRPIRAEVQLTLPSHIESIARNRHETGLAERLNGARLRSMEESVFSDPRLAHLWWLEANPERLPDLSSLDAFLQAMRQGREASGGPRYAWLPLADRFVSRLDEADLAYLVQRLAEVFRNFRQPDLADELQNYYDDPAGNGAGSGT